MHPLDVDVWKAIDRGEREIDWAAWFGEPVGADYLTSAGKDVARRAASDLTTFFGPGWLNRAHGLGRRQGPGIAGLGRFSPSLALADQFRPGAFVEAIRWWASLQFLVENAVPGITEIQHDVRSDVTEPRFLHALTQARLALMGSYLGATVVLEPTKATGGPGDVLLTTPSSKIFIEVVTLAPDGVFTMEDRATSRHMSYLRLLEARYPVHWDGDVPGHLAKAADDAWQEATAAAAAQCAETAATTVITSGAGRCLTVSPEKESDSATRTGPCIERDQGVRLLKILDEKGAHTSGAGIAWIWVEDHGGLYPFTQYSRLPLAAKLPAMAELTQLVLADRPHVAGIVVSSAARRRRPLPPDEQSSGHAGIAMIRGLPFDRVRETVVVTKDLLLPYQTRFVVGACDREAAWLDWALARLGVPGGVDSLLA